MYYYNIYFTSAAGVNDMGENWFLLNAIYFSIQIVPWLDW